MINTCFISCGNDNDESDVIPVDPKQAFKEKLIGTWKLETYIDYRQTGHEYISFEGLTKSEIDYYGLERWREIILTDDNTLLLYNNKDYKYEIVEWGKNWGGEYFDYKVNIRTYGSIWGNWDGAAKFPDNNTLYWLQQTCGYIYKRK